MKKKKEEKWHRMENEKMEEGERGKREVLGKNKRVREMENRGKKENIGGRNMQDVERTDGSRGVGDEGSGRESALGKNKGERWRKER